MDYNDRAALSVDEAAHYLGVARATLYRLMDTAIPSFHIGRRRLILRSHLDRYLQECLSEEGTRR